MSTWRKWLRTFLPWASNEESKEVQGPAPTPSQPQLQTHLLDPQAHYFLLPFKQWVLTHISPYAWDRAVIRSLAALQAQNISLYELLAPQSNTTTNGASIEILAKSIEEMYGIRIPLKEILQPLSI